ncbi:MAG: hypothetical protein LBE36_06055 [Flavobacteriaceae bacterium]|jgi:hypothetical protein|nr:hypothetical protein [Flavobacteriaceae bacterium]
MKKFKLTETDCKKLEKSVSKFENEVLKKSVINAADSVGGTLFNRHSSWNQFDKASSPR